MLLTGLTAVYYKTIIRTIIFLIVNLSPIIIIACNILDESQLVTTIRSFKIEIIILGIFQVIYLTLCIILFKIKSWKWISDSINQLDDKLKKVHIIHQFENALFLMTVSFLGIWIFLTEIYDVFNVDYYNPYSPINDQVDELDLFYLFSMIGIIPISTVLVAIEKESVSLLILFYMASCFEIVIIILRLFKYYLHGKETDPDYFHNVPMYRERLIFGILAIISLIILNINTLLFQTNFNKKFNLLLNYEIEMPKEFDYNYDPKQDDESEEEFESEEESFITRYIKYAKKKYHQYKKEISNFLE